VQLHPSFLRAAASILVLLVALAAATYFWEGYHNHHWWTRGYIVSLLVPFAFMVAVVCLASVPSHLEVSDTHLTIRFSFRRLRTVPWDDLEYYGWFEGVYGFQFHTAGTFAFYPQALPRREWRMFKSFLYTKFPERKASGFIGARFFQWSWKKKRT
jgi:hypothetical protein